MKITQKKWIMRPKLSKTNKLSEIENEYGTPIKAEVRTEEQRKSSSRQTHVDLLAGLLIVALGFFGGKDRESTPA